MGQNPIEENPVTRFILGFVLIAGMLLGATMFARILVSLGIPFGSGIGGPLGAIAVLVLFSVYYHRYDLQYDSA